MNTTFKQYCKICGEHICKIRTDKYCSEYCVNKAVELWKIDPLKLKTDY